MGDEANGSSDVAKMELEQAVFTSARSNNMSGYHLVSRSQGIDESTAQILCRWCPSHNSLASENLHTQSINMFPVKQDLYAVSRTIFGGPEYSGRGGLQTMTVLMIVSQEQFAAYENDTFALINTALSQGDLRFSLSEDTCDSVVLPDRYFAGSAHSHGECDQQVIGQAVKNLWKDKSIALVEVERPLQTVRSIIRCLPFEQRLNISFSTGLRPSTQRPFRIHVVEKVNIDRRAYFSRNQIMMISSSKTALLPQF
jgi:hypothetical protein